MSEMMFAQGRPRFTEVRVSDIAVVPGLNPPRRDEHERRARLKDSIGRRGIVAPLIVNSALTLIDGHGRYAIAKALGFETVPVMIVEGDVAELWVEINSTTLPVNGADATHMLAQGAMPTQRDQASRAEALLRALAAPELRLLAEQRVSIRIVDSARQVLRHIDRSGDEEMGRVILWLVKHKTQRLVRAAIEMEPPIPPDKLANKIDKDEDLF